MKINKSELLVTIQKYDEPLVFETGKVVRMALNGLVANFPDDSLYQQIVDKDGSVGYKIGIAKTRVEECYKEHHKKWWKADEFVDGLSDEQMTVAKKSVDLWKDILGEYN